MEFDEIDDVAGPAVDELSASDRRMVRAMLTAEAAHSGVVLLRVIAAIASVAAVVGHGITVIEYDTGDSGVFGGQAGIPDSRQIGLFLAQVASPLTFAGLLFAASYLLGVYASRLDMDIVLATEDEPTSADRKDADAAGG